ncbi:hypothetical protein MSAN_02081800 [Mycena sanguinolenta]|uniref:Uncharacterized protein n=1 Tax=Mycena sanguinolenta TaxID=230812 RepID=A0A8H6XHX3_9AGAR|nr:hypothetical protein MSAN_02081800 [Mycena sanguinolenta]
MSFEDSFGRLANDLVLRAKLSMQMGELLPYDGPLVRLILQEQHDLNARLGAMEAAGVTASTHERWPVLVILILRFAQPIGQQVRHMSAICPLTRCNTSRGFHDSVIQYRDALSATGVVDLNMNIEDPPRESVFATVETVVECGPLYIESGLIDFKLGHRYVLVKQQIEHLILQGYFGRSDQNMEFLVVTTNIQIFVSTTNMYTILGRR